MIYEFFIVTGAKKTTVFRVEDSSLERALTLLAESFSARNNDFLQMLADSKFGFIVTGPATPILSENETKLIPFKDDKDFHLLLCRYLSDLRREQFLKMVETKPKKEKKRAAAAASTSKEPKKKKVKKEIVTKLSME